MSKKIVLLVIFFFSVVGVILVGVYGTQASSSGTVLATELFFDVDADADGKKMMSSPEINEEGFVTVLLADMIVLSPGDVTYGKESLSYALTVPDSAKEFVTLSSNGWLTFYKSVNVIVTVRTTDGSNLSDKLYYFNDLDGEKPSDVDGPVFG